MRRRAHVRPALCLSQTSDDATATGWYAPAACVLCLAQPRGHLRCVENGGCVCLCVRRGATSENTKSTRAVRLAPSRTPRPSRPPHSPTRRRVTRPLAASRTAHSPASRHARACSATPLADRTRATRPLTNSCARAATPNRQAWPPRSCKSGTPKHARAHTQSGKSGYI